MIEMSDWNFKLNYSGGSDILRTYPGLKKAEEELIQNRLAQVKAQFLNDFGVEGNFKIEFTQGSRRMNYRIRSADKRTSAILSKRSGWLKKV